MKSGKDSIRKKRKLHWIKCLYPLKIYVGIFPLKVIVLGGN